MERLGMGHDKPPSLFAIENIPPAKRIVPGFSGSNDNKTPFQSGQDKSSSTAAGRIEGDRGGRIWTVDSAEKPLHKKPGLTEVGNFFFTLLFFC